MLLAFLSGTLGSTGTDRERRLRAARPDLHHRLVLVVQQCPVHHLLHSQSGRATVLADRAATRAVRSRRYAQLWLRVSGGQRRSATDRLPGHRSGPRANAEHTDQFGVVLKTWGRLRHTQKSQRSKQKLTNDNVQSTPIFFPYYLNSNRCLIESFNLQRFIIVINTYEIFINMRISSTHFVSGSDDEAHTKQTKL